MILIYEDIFYNIIICLIKLKYVRKYVFNINLLRIYNREWF